MRNSKGYTLIILMVVVSVMAVGLLVAVPVWQNQIQREKEEELIFRGKQYVEAIRLYQMKNPGAFPKSLEELKEKKCIRKLYKDPMTEKGEWNLVLNYPGVSLGKEKSPQKVLLAPQEALSEINSPQIIGVASKSTKKSIKIYLEKDSYDQWLFYYGQDPNKSPEIVYYNQLKKD